MFAEEWSSGYRIRRYSGGTSMDADGMGLTPCGKAGREQGYEAGFEDGLDARARLMSNAGRVSFAQAWHYTFSDNFRNRYYD